MKVNFADEEDLKPFVPVPRGRYLLTVTRSEMSVTKADEPKHEVDFTIAEGEYMGRQINFQNFTFGEKARKFTKNFAVACGFDKDATVDYDDEEFVASFVGRQVYADVAVKPEDKVNGYAAQNKINFYYPVEAANASGSEGGSEWMNEAG